MEFKDKIKNINPKSTYLSKFLNSDEQRMIINQFKNTDYQLVGGYINPEYKRFLLNVDDPKITCFYIEHNSNYLTLTHRNILGTLLSLGIERNTIGDILVEESVFFCTSEIKDFLLQEFTAIAHQPINLKEIDGTHVKRQIKLEEYQSFVDSMRLDLVISRICAISRDKAKLMIENELIKVNHQVTLKPTKLIQEDDILSIRKHGRYIITDTSKRSKKNKIMMIYHKFI